MSKSPRKAGPRSRAIDYVITSTFDLDRGPVVLHQYPPMTAAWPGSVSLDDTLHFFPELLLPDQVHSRAQDANIFTLHYNPRTNRYLYAYDEANGFIEVRYAYNIIQLRQDQEHFRRGALVKLICLITKVNFFDIFKPVMMLALDAYFANNDINVLRELYEVVNGIPLLQVHEQLTLLTPRIILLQSLISPSISPYLDAFPSQFRNKLLNLHHLPQDVFRMVNGIPVASSRNGHEAAPAVAYRSTDMLFEVQFQFQGLRLPLRVPTLVPPEQISTESIWEFLCCLESAKYTPPELKPVPNLRLSVSTTRPSITLPPAHPNDELLLYGNATPPAVILINAVLTHRRVVLVGYSHNAQSICDYVLFVLQLVGGGGLLSGLVHRVFPFVDISKLDVLQQLPSYIAGTANPLFKDNDRLWDVLWNLDENEVLISRVPGATFGSDVSLPPGTAGTSGDTEHIDATSSITLRLGRRESFTVKRSSTGGAPGSSGVTPRLQDAPHFNVFSTPEDSGAERDDISIMGSAEPRRIHSITREDARFLTGLRLIAATKHDDGTILLFLRRHVNEILRLLHLPPPPAGMLQHPQSLPVQSLVSQPVRHDQLFGSGTLQQVLARANGSSMGSDENMMLPGQGIYWTTSNSTEYETYAAVRQRYFHPPGTSFSTLVDEYKRHLLLLAKGRPLSVNGFHSTHSSLHNALPPLVYTLLPLQWTNDLKMWLDVPYQLVQLELLMHGPQQLLLAPPPMVLVQELALFDTLTALLRYLLAAGTTPHVKDAFVLMCQLLQPLLAGVSTGFTAVYDNHGLNVICLHLLHRSTRVRQVAARLLMELERTPVGKFWINEMNLYYRHAFAAARKKIADEERTLYY